MKALVLAFLACLLLVVPARALTIQVPGQQPTIQQGLNAASPGDTVLVAPGAYLENIVWPATQGLCLRSEAGAEGTDILGNSPSNPDSGSVVVFPAGLDETTVLQGFTLTGGTGTLDPFPTPQYKGGGIWFKNSSPTIADNIITGNDHGRIAVGGGIACDECAPVIRGNRISDNRATNTQYGFGGAIFIYASTAMIAGNEIFENTARWGGGIVSLESFSIIDQNTITGNTAILNGGGIEFQPAFPGSTPGGAPIITGNTITGNMSQDGYGGGIYGRGPTGGQIPLIAGNIVTANVGGGISCDATHGPMAAIIEYCSIADNLGPGISCEAWAAPSVEYCVISNNDGAGVLCAGEASPEIHHNDISGHGLECGIRNTSLSVTVPAELNWWGEASGPYHPMTNPSGLGDQVSDYVAYDPWSIASGVEQSAGQASPSQFVLRRNRPNPFNPFTTIEFSLPHNNQVTLRIYNVLGQEVETLVNETKAAGTHSVSWNAGSVASGVYFYRIEAGDWSETRPMTLVR